jgi:hypothetical protein
MIDPAHQSVAGKQAATLEMLSFQIVKAFCFLLDA